MASSEQASTAGRLPGRSFPRPSPHPRPLSRPLPSPLTGRGEKDRKKDRWTKGRSGGATWPPSVGARNGKRRVRRLVATKLFPAFLPSPGEGGREGAGEGPGVRVYTNP